MFFGLLLLYPTLRQTLPFLFYSIQSLTTENEHRTVAKCEDVTWSTATNDSASWGMLGIIDSRPVPARLRHYVTLTGSIKNQPYISITAREYEPYPHFGVEKHSAEIELQVSKSGTEDAANITFVDRDLYSQMYSAGGGIGGWLVVLPKTSTLPQTEFDQLAKCYREHNVKIGEVFPLRIAAFVRLK